MVNMKRLLANTEANKRKVRLLGVSVSNFLDAQSDHSDDTCWVQLPLPFEDQDSSF